ncbi:hypothetical protein K438DRAFT_1015039 [Mycena galopus ATCC 62051]|nr:hypothetical protein K438DRAFT_1015039 [Mycena galopus ATCC 62051]
MLLFRLKAMLPALNSLSLLQPAGGPGLNSPWIMQAIMSYPQDTGSMISKFVTILKFNFSHSRRILIRFLKVSYVRCGAQRLEHLFRLQLSRKLSMGFRCVSDLRFFFRFPGSQ